jgi:hypothetical protein
VRTGLLAVTWKFIVSELLEEPEKDERPRNSKMSASASSSDGEPVYLHLYDLSMGMAAGMSQAFLGISM